MDDPSLSRSFFETLHPLLRRLNAERTLSPGKVGILRHLAWEGRATTSQLSAAVQVSPQAISLAARELEVLQYVVRVPGTEDRRRVWTAITDAGRQKLAQDLSAGQVWLDRAITGHLSAGEREALEAVIPVLRKLGSEIPGE